MAVEQIQYSQSLLFLLKSASSESKAFTNKVKHRQQTKSKEKCQQYTLFLTLFS